MPRSGSMRMVWPPYSKVYCACAAVLAKSSAAIANSATGVTWVKDKANPSTPFVSTPGLVTAECVDKNGFSYLEVHVNADPKDPRTDDINGDVVANGKVAEDWGLHLIDANLAMGNLVDVVGAESKAYAAKAAKK